MFVSVRFCGSMMVEASRGCKRQVAVSAKGRLMTAEEFLVAFRSDIDQLLGQVSRRYSVADVQVAGAIQSAVRKYILDAPVRGHSDGAAGSDGRPISSEQRQGASDLIRSL